MALRIPLFFVALFVVGQASAAVLEFVKPTRTGSRELLQAKKSCNVEFGSMDYTPITSVCQPPYPKDPCCSSVVSFICPYAEQFNDVTMDCPDVFFGYLYQAGNYSPGIFSNLCVGKSEGLPCPLAPAPAPSSSLPHFQPRTLSWVLSSLLVAFFW